MKKPKFFIVSTCRPRGCQRNIVGRQCVFRKDEYDHVRCEERQDHKKQICYYIWPSHKLGWEVTNNVLWVRGTRDVTNMYFPERVECVGSECAWMTSLDLTMFGSLHLDALESQPFTWSGTCCNFDVIESLIVDDRSTTALVGYIMFSVMSIRHLRD